MALPNSLPEGRVFSAHWISVWTYPADILDKKVNIKIPNVPAES
jgi:hypothetical protein